jgi:hypothetical protein
MPDLLALFIKRWKLIIGLTVVATVIALVAALLSPKEFLSTATALPANSMVADKGRIFNNNIQELYSDFGTPDELDRLEGTAALDTIFIAASNEFNLAGHYLIEPSGESVYKAALKLRKNSKINRSAYGELKVKVWDVDRNIAAALANSLMQKIQELHQHLQNQNNESILKRVKEDYALKQEEYKKIADSLTRSSGSDAEIGQAKKTALLEQLQQYEKVIDEYRLSLKTNPQVLLTVENARASLWPDKPNVQATVLITFFASFVFAFLLAAFLQSRKARS